MKGAGPRAGRRLGFALAAVSVFTSAGLLFTVEPMVARMLLPRHGGSPAVWNTALVFYQAILLAGYAYAHASVSRLGWRRQMGLHLLVVLAPLLVLPPWPGAVGGRLGTWPVLAVLAALASAVALPMFALSANASLSQRWYASARGPGGPDPYRLYAASNAGSLLALAAYPFLIEPLAGLRAQAWAWTLGYGLFVLLTLALMIWSLPRASAGVAAGDPRDGLAPAAVSASAAGPGRRCPVSRRRRAGWLVRSAVPVSLFMSATLVITTDIVALPLLWVLPLAIYLATYILAFAWPERLPRSILAGLAGVGVALALVAQLLQLALPPAVLVGLALGPLVFGGLVCHVDLARDRPEPAQLTEFYLWLALGGVVGGVLNSLVAPVLFSSLAEHPLGLVALAWLLPGQGAATAWLGALRRPGGWLPAATMMGLVLAAAWRLPLAEPYGRVLWLLAALAVLPYGLLFRPRWGHFTLAVSLLAVLAISGRASLTPVLEQARSFFGVVKVLQAGDRRVMMHGTTIHGAQMRDPALRSVPPAYYHPDGPLGRLVAAQGTRARIGLVGLGTGALAALSRPGQTVRVFEIDPLVERLARRHFSFLADAPADVAVDVVDGRLGLAAEGDGSFDLLVLDAFTGDAVPAHLLTAEALDLARRKLRPGGVALFHISNRSLDLARVFRGWSRRTGRPVAIQRWEPGPAARAEGATTTLAVAIGADDAALRRLVADPAGGWRLLDTIGPAVTWTDDRSSLVGVLGAPAAKIGP